MKKLFVFLLLSILLMKTGVTQIIDRAPKGHKNILPVEGGGILMELDTTTSLEKLIDRLDSNWTLIETGKAYWIGYTNDMFSVAAKGDEAIPRLVNFFEKAKTKKGKDGVLYTLHLIGIERKIVGRFEEEFKNAKARLALLQLMDKTDSTRLIIKLLMRDPWQSDIPYYFNILNTQNKSDDVIWPVVNCLKRYNLKDLPIGQPIPDSINKLSINLRSKNSNTFKKGFDFDGQVKEALKGFQSNYPSKIYVDESLYNQKIPGFSINLSGSLSINEFLMDIGIEPDDIFSYDTFGAKLQYYIYNNTLFFCSVRVAQSRLNNWWHNLSSKEKEKFR